MSGSRILVWDRRRGQMVLESVPDEAVLRLLYDSRAGRWAAGILSRSMAFSRIYGARYRGRSSRRKIEPFIRRYGLVVGDFEEGPYASFNDFFARRFRPGIRDFVTDPSLMPAFAEARYLGWESATPSLVFPVKRHCLTVETLLGGRAEAAEFLHGPLLVARLAPQDYHRVHFVDAGRIVEHRRIPGSLHSVNPIALSSVSDVLSTNAREVTVQDTAGFGRIAYVEVGAMTVGRIIQHVPPGATPARGAEKSHFEYGASTVVLLGQPGRWIPDPEILDRTRQGIETFVELGTVVARASARL